MNPNPMTETEARQLTAVALHRWPQPELTAPGVELYARSLAATTLSAADAQHALEALMASRTTGFRPEPGEIAAAARKQRPRYHEPYAPALPAAPVPPDVARSGLAAARAALVGTANTAGGCCDEPTCGECEGAA